MKPLRGSFSRIKSKHKIYVLLCMVLLVHVFVWEVGHNVYFYLMPVLVPVSSTSVRLAGQRMSGVNVHVIRNQVPPPLSGTKPKDKAVAVRQAGVFGAESDEFLRVDHPLMGEENGWMPFDPVRVQQPHPRKRHSLVAAGWFSGEQLPRGLQQFISLAAAAGQWKKHVVLPRVISGRMVGLGRLGLPFAGSDSTIWPLDAYFDLTRARRVFAEQNVDVVTEPEAKEICKNRWSLLFLATDWKNAERACWTNSSALLAKASRMQKRLLASQSPEMVVEENCDWIQDCVAADLRKLRPFTKIVCAAVPTLHSMRWGFAELASKLEILRSDDCVFITRWHGPEQHGLVPHQMANQAAMATMLRPAAKLRDIAIRLISGSQLRSGYAVVHVSTEDLRARCERGRCAPDGLSVHELFTRCFRQLSAVVTATVPMNTPLLLDFNEESDTSSRQSDENTTSFLTRLVADLRKKYPRVLLASDLYRTATTEDDSVILGQPAFKSLVEATVLTSGEFLFAIGGGSYEGALLAARRVYGVPSASSRDKVVCPRSD